MLLVQLKLWIFVGKTFVDVVVSGTGIVVVIVVVGTAAVTAARRVITAVQLLLLLLLQLPRRLVRRWKRYERL